jgi:transposase
MYSSTPSPQNDLSSGAVDALLKGLSAVDAAVAQAEIDRLIQAAIADAADHHRHERAEREQKLLDTHKREVLAAQEAHQDELQAIKEAHQREALAAEAAHQKEMREARAAYQEHIQSIYEQIRLSRQRLFGRSSEAHPGQLSLQFDEIEQTAEDSTAEHDQALISTADAQASEGSQKASRSTPRARGKRNPIPPHITRVEIVIDVPESQRVCSCCGKTMVEIGEDISEQLTIIPMKIQALQYHRKRYGCPTREHAPVIADRPPQVLPKSNASNDLLAMLITAKYVDGLPLARMEYILGRAGAVVPRVTLARWMIQTAEKLKPLEDAMNQVLIQHPVLQIDETPVQVLKEKDRSPSTKSYMWVRKGGPPERPVILYHYAPSRGKAVPIDLLKDWQGFLMCDGYGAYDEVGHRPDVTLLACWVHARRGFVDAIKLQPKEKEGRANEMVKMIAKLYKVEKESQLLTSEERFQLRQNISKPILETIRKWLDANIPVTAPKSALGKAMAYMDKLWPRLIRYIEAGHLPIDNNETERAIRPFAIGRRAWLFSDTPAGAEASARLYSMVETAKANGLEPYTWLLKLMRGLPEASKSGNFEHLMPWNCKAEDLITDAYGSTGPTS